MGTGILVLSGVFFIAFLNLGLGFGAALVLNRGPRDWRVSFGGKCRSRLSRWTGGRFTIPDQTTPDSSLVAAASENAPDQAPPDEPPAPPTYEQTLELLAATRRTFEVNLTNWTNSLSAAGANATASQLEELLEKIETEAHALLGTLNNHLYPLNQAARSESPDASQFQSLHDNVEAVWKELSDQLAQFAQSRSGSGKGITSAAVRQILEMLQTAVGRIS